MEFKVQSAQRKRQGNFILIKDNQPHQKYNSHGKLWTLQHNFKIDKAKFNNKEETNQFTVVKLTFLLQIQ